MCRLQGAGDGREDRVDLAAQDAQNDDNDDSDQHQNKGILDETLAFLQFVQLAHVRSPPFLSSSGDTRPMITGTLRGGEEAPVPREKTGVPPVEAGCASCLLV